MSLHLVTTADERSWPKKGKVLFLGEWCKKYDRKSQWSKAESTVARPYAIDPDQKKDIHKYADNLFEILLCELVKELNRFHGVGHSKRYWYIFIGPWLHRYIKVILNRYGSLSQAISSHKISTTTILEFEKEDMSNLTYSGFVHSLNNDSWNHQIYANMLQNWPNIGLNFINKNVEQSSDIFKKEVKNKTLGRNKYLKNLVLIFFRFLTIFERKTDAVIINSYLPIIKEIQLSILLGQIPQLRKTPEVDDVCSDPSFRNKFFQNYKRYKGVERELRRMIHILIPRCYLEGYKSISMQSKRMPWPSEPRFVFTSNNFSSDELFKLWVAKKIENGTAYYVGQHGSNYGTLKGSEIWPEINTCDRFISWGWSSAYSVNKAMPAFVFKTISRSYGGYNKNGGAVLILRGPGNRDGCHDRCFEHISYQEKVLNFYNNLHGNIADKFTIRLHHGSSDKKTVDSQTWSSQNSKAVVDEGFTDLNRLIRKSRIVIHTYDSSGILETLSLNIPTIGFWSGGLDHVMTSALPFYQELADVGIIHLDNKSVEVFLNENWDSIEVWWHSKKVQKARLKFCNRYARRVSHPLLSLKKTLLNDL
jgi:putative transferase (TIGR04331 family)